MLDGVSTLIVTGLWLAVTVVASAHAVLNKRDVRAAIGWVGVIWMAPVVGAAAYAVLGVNRIRRRAQALRVPQGRPRPAGAQAAPALPAAAEHSHPWWRWPTAWSGGRWSKGTRWSSCQAGRSPTRPCCAPPMVVHPRDADQVWVFPMDGTTLWPRVSPDGKPAAYVTRNAGKSCTRQDKGFPRSHAWWTVKRQAMTNDTHEAVGLYVGTTQGEIWASRNEGATWTCIARHLPEIYSVEAATLGR